MAAEWPLSGMSNFGYPEFVYGIERQGPATLIVVFDDGSEQRREKSGFIPIKYTERWKVNRTDAKAMTEFYESKGMESVFDRKGLDPLSGTNFTNDLVTCRFDKPIKVQQIGPSWYQVTCVFMKVKA